MDNVIQGSDEWFQLRLGKVTASRLSDVMAKNKSKGYSATRKNYMAEKVVEVLTGKPIPEKFKSAAMQHGNDTEDFARMGYENRNLIAVDEVGFVLHPRIDRFGYSPDGLVGEDGTVEIKCPNTATHLEMIEGKQIIKTYRDQIHGGMACTGRKWCDFVSYDPLLPEKHSLFTQRVYYNRESVAEIETEVIKFLKELDDKLKKLNEV